MKIEPPDHLKPFIYSYDVLEWEKMDANIFLPAWTNNFLFFKYGDYSDVELSSGKYLKGYDAMVTGCMTYALKFVKTTITAGMIAVDLKPATLYSLLNRDISFTTNNSLYADEIFPGSSKVVKQIKGVTDITQRIEFINDFLTNIFKGLVYDENIFIKTFFDEFKNSIIEEKSFSIQNIANNLNISERNYRRVFKKIIGTTPKLYYRIKRLENVLSQLHENSDKKYLDILKGYVDQSHFIKDFVRFTGRNPKELQKYFNDNKHKKIYDYLK